MPEFNNNRLFLGGDVGSERGNNVMQLLHDQQQLEKSVEVVSGVYLGGFQAAKKAVRRGDLDAAKLRCCPSREEPLEDARKGALGPQCLEAHRTRMWLDSMESDRGCFDAFCSLGLQHA